VDENMPTLTEASRFTRKGVKYFALSIVVYFILKFAVTIGIAIYKQLNPEPPAPPTYNFGVLPALSFPQSSKYQINFTLETPQGVLPLPPYKMNVYYSPFKKPTFSAYAEAESLAKRLKFFNEPKSLSSEVYEWTRKIPSPLTLNINSLTGSFSLTYQWTTDLDLLVEKNVPGKSQTYKMATDFFGGLGKPVSDIDFNNGTIKYLKVVGGQLHETVSPAEAHFVKADFFRYNIDYEVLYLMAEDRTILQDDSFEVLTPDPDEGTLSMLISGSRNSDKKYIDVSYDYYPISYEAPETYSLKNINTAWSELVNGNAYIAKGSELTDVKIRRVYLAYYDAKIEQDFIQPIYVFSDAETQANFVAYIPAVDPNWVQK
jgi:hypothetical protein